MAAPAIETVFPSNGSNGIPVGADIEIVFDKGIDLRTAKDNCVLYGADFDKTSGPDGATWTEGSNNQLFLKSPGFSGVVECKFSLVYVDTNGSVVTDPVAVLDRNDETDNNYRHKLIISPKTLLATEVDYTAYFIGDSEGGTSKGISSRTVFDTDLTSVTSETGVLYTYGGYTGTADTTVNLKITTVGDLGKAKYQWWYDFENESAARTGKVTSRRWRRLEDGLQVRWSGSGFVEGDIYRFKVYGPEYLSDSFKLQFSTGTGSVIEVPDTASTSVIGTQTELGTILKVLKMNPADGASHQNEKKKIVIQFSGNLDPDSITNESVAIYKYPISGVFSGPSGTNFQDPEELFKKLTVDGDKLTIDIA